MAGVNYQNVEKASPQIIQIISVKGLAYLLDFFYVMLAPFFFFFLKNLEIFSFDLDLWKSDF